jgi:quinol-cytochrome oxidoreductase complex cytochrome b subunit
MLIITILDRVIAGGFMYLGFVVPAYSYAYFAPTIIKSFGYSAVRTQLLSVPPWAVSFVFAMVIATFSDLAKHRFLFVIFPLLVALAGFATLLGVKHNHHTQYGALFLAVSGVYSTMPVIVCWFNSNRELASFVISDTQTNISISGRTLAPLRRNRLPNRIR